MAQAVQTVCVCRAMATPGRALGGACASRGLRRFTVIYPPYSVPSPLPQASHGALSRHSHSHSRTHCLPACSCPLAQVLSTCSRTPLQLNLTIVLELWSSMSSRKGAFARLPGEQHMPPLQTTLPPTAPIALTHKLELLGLPPPLTGMRGDFLPLRAALES